MILVNIYLKSTNMYPIEVIFCKTFMIVFNMYPLVLNEYRIRRHTEYRLGIVLGVLVL